MTENITTIKKTDTRRDVSREYETPFFKLICFVSKYTYRIILSLIAAGMIALAVRSAFPMNLPEHKGMTYYEFLGDRWERLGNMPHTDKKAILFLFVFEPVIFIISGPAEVPFCELYPDSKFTAWVRETLIDGSNYELIRPRNTEITFGNLPKMLWEAWERSVWDTYVLNLGRGS